MNPLQAPIDYWSQLSATDAGAGVDAAIQQGFAKQIAGAQLQQKLKQQQQLDVARAEAIKSPSAAAFNKLLILDPGSHEAIKTAWQAKDKDTQTTELSELSAVRGYLKAGRPEMARKLVQRRIDADKKAGQDTADDEMFIELIDENPDEAAGHVDYMLAGVMGPEKWESTFRAIGDERRADEKLPGEMAKTVAEATQAQAGAAKTLTETGEIAPNAASQRQLNSAQVANYQSAITERAARLELDRDTLETNAGLELEKLTQAREAKGVDLSATSEKALTDAVVSAESSRQLANRASGLADKIEGATLSGGWAAWVAQNAQGAFGSPNLLRKEYTQLINAQAVKNLPPGPASDKDIKLALQGFPAPTANAATMASFLRGMAKLQTIAANRDQGRADWISENGNLGRARRDITVNGVKVPAGATFADFSTSAASVERKEAVGERSYMRHANGGR